MLVTLDRTLNSTNLAQPSAQVGPVVERAQISGKEIVAYAFQKAVLFLALACALILMTVLLGRRLRPRRPEVIKPSP